MSIIAKGLDGIIVDTTTISQVTPETSSLTYRGYRVHELAEKCRFEEVAHLILRGELPTREQLISFNLREREQRSIDQTILSVLKHSPKDAHPMDVVRTGVSMLGMMRNDTLEMDIQAAEDAAIQMLAQIPTMTATYFRARHNKEVIPPDHNLGFSENFFHMAFGKVPDEVVVKTFDVSMVLYAEHSFNASTFASRVVASTLSDIYSAVVGGICALKGPLHGGANEAVMHMLKEIGDPSRAPAWIEDALANKKKVMGFGHRVYKKQDSRAPTMQHHADLLAAHLGETKWQQTAKIVEETMIGKKNIYPNLDYPAGPAYYMMGFDIDLFTPFFVMSRITGWCAHIIEQMKDNRLIRPLADYSGPAERDLVPIEQRQS